MIIKIAKDVKQRHYAFNVLRDLVLLVKFRMPGLFSRLIQNLLTEGLEELLKVHFSINHNYRRESTELH